MGGDVMNVKDVISPLAFSLWQFFGYALFVVIWLVVLIAALQGLLEVKEPLKAASSRVRKRNLPSNVVLFPTQVRRVGRGY
jgi:hypothetical protein